MWINRIKVTGDYGFDYTFSEINILLGENGTGKSTFVNLLLYALGVKINGFIDEISKYKFCDYVYLEIKTKLNHKFLITRKLPYVDNVTIIPYDEDERLVEDNIRILNLTEYSDFLLEEELYKKEVIQYGDKTATLTYRFLLRTALVDQTTPHQRVLANIAGDKNDFLNNQALLKNAIIEKILNTLNQDLQKLRLDLKQTEKEHSEVKEKISFYQEVRDEFNLGHESSYRKVEKIDDELKKIEEERQGLLNFKYEQLNKLEKVNDKEYENRITTLRKEINSNKLELANLSFEKNDLENMTRSFEKELSEIKKRLASRKVLRNIPVTICPVCFSKLDDVSETGLCPHCKEVKPQEVIDSIAKYKRQIEETLFEVNGLINENLEKSKKIKANISSIEKELSTVENSYIDRIGNVKSSINTIIAEIEKRLVSITDRNYKLQESKRTLIKLNKLKGQSDILMIKIKSLREEIKEEEKKSSDELMIIIKFEETFKNMFNKIYGSEHEISISREDYMPVIDGTELTNSGHSESIKVVAHLSYITSLFVLNNYLDKTKINNIGFVVFDSPRDKDLDIDKYERFLKTLSEQNEGQVFLTGSNREHDLYNKHFNERMFIDNLTTDSKLLKKQ